MAYRVIERNLNKQRTRVAKDTETHRRGPRSTLAFATGGQQPGGWPMYCDATGVLPEQIAEAKAENAKRGINIDYTPDGRAIYEDPAQRRRHCESMGYFDRNGSYGDPQPGGYFKHMRDEDVE